MLIPAANVPNLMLREDVVQAVAEGKFHIYPVSTVDEGMELLTCIPAGVRGPDGCYPPGTVNALVDARLAELSEDRPANGNGKAAAKAAPAEEGPAEPPHEPVLPGEQPRPAEES